MRSDCQLWQWSLSVHWMVKLCTVPASVCRPAITHNICSCFCEADIISATTVSPEMELLFGRVINDFSTKVNMDLLLTGSSNP